MPPLVLILIFVGVFTVIALPVIAIGSSRKTKQVLATLDSALATETPSAREQIVNLRKDSTLSSIPWLNRRLLKFQLAPYLHRLLKQADVKWSTGKLLLISAGCFAVPAFGVYNQWGNPLAGTGSRTAVGLRRRLPGLCSCATGGSSSFKGIAGSARPDGERAARRTQPDRGHGPGGARVRRPGGRRVQGLLRRAELRTGTEGRARQHAASHAAAGSEDYSYRHHDPERERRQPGRGARQDRRT